MVSGRLFDPPEVTPAAETMPLDTLAPSAAPTLAPVDTRAAERAERIVLLAGQLQAKRRELRMIRRRAVLYNRPQTHHPDQYEQLSGEIQALIDQITTAEEG
jgi:hypothetical protein